MPWRRKWQPTPVSLPGKSHGQRSLGGHIIHGVTKELDMTELSTHQEKEGGRKETHIHISVYYNLIYKDRREEYARAHLEKPKKP